MTERVLSLTEAAEREAQADALETELLRRKAEADPTPANKVAHAVARWRQGCVHGAPGACGECNDLFLAVLRSHLGEASPPRIDRDRKRPELVDDVAIRGAIGFRMEMMAHNRAWIQVETLAGRYTFWLDSGRSRLKITEGEHER